MTSPIHNAQRVVATSYGDTVSVYEKGKSLNKFGRNFIVGSADWETIAELQGTESHETFVSTNLIDGLSSDNAADTSLTLVVEGHTIDGQGNLTFSIQSVTTDATDGRTEVALGTPIARANRIYVANSGTFDSPQAAPTGNIYVYDNTGGVTNGVPDSASQTKLVLLAGETQSEKCAPTISSQDYWFLTYASVAIGNTSGNAAFVTCRMETRDVANGGVWRPLGRDYTLWQDTVGIQRTFTPLLVVPKNHDWRFVARSNSNNAEVYAEAGGHLAGIVD